MELNTETKINSKVVAHSKNEQGDELLSVLITFPRFILAELNTHRQLSKNSASSRAIPFNKMVEAIQSNPFIPIAWQKDHKGMQGSEYITDENEIQECTNEWLFAKQQAIFSAEILTERNKVTKQICNRLLEPFMWHTVLVTGNVNKEGWLNFFDLRCPQYTTPVMGEGFYAKSWNDLIENHSDKDNLQLLEDNKDNTLFKLQHNKGQAEIHMMTLAEAIYDSWQESTPKQLKSGDWHIPFIDKIDIDEVYYKTVKGIFPSSEYSHGEKDYLYNEALIKISTAMAAHTSYTLVGEEKDKSIEKWIELHDKLVAYNPPHSSPMEHCARVMSKEEYNMYWKSYGTKYKDKNEIKKVESGWCRNFKGFIQYRHILEK